MHRSSPVLLLLPVLSLFGCASPGPPRPPSLHLPETARGLAAERVGDEVHVSWISPSDTTDGDRIKQATTAVLCRQLPPKGACTPVQRVEVVTGSSTATDLLPPDLASGPLRLLAYRVELLNAGGHSAGVSDPIFAPGGAAPPPVGPLLLSARRNAVLVRWTSAAPSSAVMELTRTSSANAAAGQALPAPHSEDATPPRNGAPPRASKAAAGAMVLRSPQPTASAPDEDRGGLLDATAKDAETYTYVAQRVTDVVLGGHGLHLRGVPSPPASFTFHDSIPPQAPTGLVSIPDEGFGAPLSVDLSWEPNPETDLLGYNVYRRMDAAEFRRINDVPVHAPAYRDLKVDAGHTYAYRVTAVDARGNESNPSAEVHESPRR